MFLLQDTRHCNSSIIDTTNEIIINDVINLTRRWLHGISSRIYTIVHNSELQRPIVICWKNNIVKNVHNALFKMNECYEWEPPPPPPPSYTFVSLQ